MIRIALRRRKEKRMAQTENTSNRHETNSDTRMGMAGRVAREQDDL